MYLRFIIENIVYLIVCKDSQPTAECQEAKDLGFCSFMQMECKKTCGCGMYMYHEM